MQLGDLGSEVEFLKSLKQASDEAGINSDGNEAFNFERETLVARISSLQNQMRMQQETEVELREQNDALMARVRKAETLQSNKENEMFHQMREMQAKDMELKNAGIFEFNLKQRSNNFNSREWIWKINFRITSKAAVKCRSNSGKKKWKQKVYAESPKA